MTGLLSGADLPCLPTPPLQLSCPALPCPALPCAALPCSCLMHPGLTVLDANHHAHSQDLTAGPLNVAAQHVSPAWPAIACSHHIPLASAMSIT